MEIIGYDELVLLGYRDSGMAGTPANSDPRAFAAQRLDETVERLVGRDPACAAQVIVTYGDDHEHYPHPDHIRVHEISVAAFSAAGDPEAFPAAGEPYQPAKLYYSVWSRARILATHAKFLELGLESPFDEGWLERPGEEDQITTSIDLTGFEDVRRLALLAHATQVDPSPSTGSGSLPRSCGRSTPSTSTSSPRAWSKRSYPKMTCSPGYGSPPAGSIPPRRRCRKRCGGHSTSTPRRTKWPSG